MPVREHLGIGVAAADKRVVGRNGAVVANAQDFADVAVQVLREIRTLSFSFALLGS